MATKKKSLSDTFLDLINPAPLPFDPEDTEEPETVAKVVENEEIVSEEDITTSALRKRKFDFLEDGDERYLGTRISRKCLKSEENYSDSENNLSDDAGISDSAPSDSSENEEIGDHNEDKDSYNDETRSSQEEDESKDGSDDEATGSNISEQDNEGDSNFQHISKGGSELEVKKGVAVRNQLNIWDSLLECRITFQKSLVAVNKFPQYNTFPQFISQDGSKFKTEVKRTNKSVATLLEKLIQFQSTMLQSYPETKNIDMNVKTKAVVEDDEINSDTEEEEKESSSSEENIKVKKQESSQLKKKRSLKEYAKLLEEHHNKYKEYWNATIQKWNDKTRVSVGKVSSRNFSNFEQSTLKQIEHVLSNRHRLIQRTQLKRSSFNILGQEIVREENDLEPKELNPTMDNLKNKHDENKEYNTEIFDDSDFYHQLLRELIERKSSDVTDPVQLSRQWLQLQKLRSKMKRKIDTRATKGRKIRYAVHQKLVNFMAPINQNHWSEEAKTELYNSLFGNSKRY